MKIGDRVRRCGILAEIFGDEQGTVIDVHQGEEGEKCEVHFGTRNIVYSLQQIMLSEFFVGRPRRRLL